MQRGKKRRVAAADPGYKQTMPNRILPRYRLTALALSMTVMGVLLTVFYFQYNRTAGELVRISIEEQQRNLEASFERRSRAQLHQVVHKIESLGNADKTLIQDLLIDNVEHGENIYALRLVLNDGSSLTVGDIPPIANPEETVWLPERILLTYPAGVAGVSIGRLEGSFNLDSVTADIGDFTERMNQKGLEREKYTFLWIAAATLLSVAGIGALIWAVANNFSHRVHAIRAEIQKLSSSDYGQPLTLAEHDELGELARVFNDMRDKLRETTISRDYLDNVLGNMNEAIVITSADGEIVRVNDAMLRMLHFSESELMGQPLADFVDTKLGSPLIVEEHMEVPREAFFMTKEGASLPVSYTGSTIPLGEGMVGRYIFAAQNITERRRAEQRIRYLARIDSLTKVPNRMQFQHLLQRAISRSRRSQQQLSLLYIDIDHFKEINDTFGHLAGDATLETLTERLTAALPEQSIIGRLAGDEFAIIVNDNTQIGTVTGQSPGKLARSLLDRLAEPFYVQGQEVFMTASMGIANYPEDAANVIDLIRNADAALYHAKRSGGNVYSMYVPEMNEAAVERLMTKSKLKRAFERNELLVHYQPKFNLETGEIFGAEALVRWELPERGIILPSDFIPLAEETNLIIEIGEWVLDRVCADFRHWQQSVSSPGRVSVNLSLKQLKQPNFIGRMSAILKRHGVSPTSLELEITETTLMENPQRTIKILNELYGLGLHLAIDDFGTGYSSLSALQQFPIDTLKIDQSFVRDIVSNPDDATIVGTIIQMGRNLKMDVVAEGVETEAQLNFLQTQDCTYVQGHLFGDAMSSDNYLELLLSQAEGTDSHRILFT